MSDIKVERGKRLVMIRDHYGLNQRQFAEELGLKQGSYSSIERGKTGLSIGTLDLISQKFNVDINWLLWGKVGENLADYDRSGRLTLWQHSTGNFVQVNGESVQPLTLSVEDLPEKIKQKNILVPVKAYAGYLGGFTQEFVQKELRHVCIPDINEEARTFEVDGDSMLPFFMSGDYAVGTRVDRIENIKSGEIYVVISYKSGISIKRVYVDNHDLILKPDNFIEFLPTHLPIEEVKEIWKVKAKITANFEELDVLPTTQRLRRVEQYLSSKFDDFSVNKGYLS